MRLLPRTSFGRAALLIAAVLLIGELALMLVLRYRIVGPASDQMAHLLADQVRMVDALLAATPPPQRAAALADVDAGQGAYLLTQTTPPGGEPLLYYQARFRRILRARLGPTSEFRVQSNGETVLWVRPRSDAGYWLGMTARRLESGVPAAFFGWLALLAATSVAAAFVLARYLTRHLRKLALLAERLGRGESVAVPAHEGPLEIRELGAALRRMAADIKQGEEDRALLLAGISHDLRTPLARLRLAVEMLPTAEAEIRDGMVEDVEEMDGIVGQFIALVRDGRDEVPVRVDVDDLVRSVCTRFQRAGGSLELKLGESGHLPLRPTAFGRMLSNLLENARRHADGATAVEVERKRGRLRVSVLDAGPGIAEDRLESVFLPFAHGGKGSGLGLMVARRIARLHGGELTLHPRRAGGLEARIALPCADAGD